MFTSTRNTVRNAYTARREPEYARMLASLYWYALLAVVALMVVGIVSLSLLHFFGLFSVAPVASEAEVRGGSVPSLDRAGLEAIVEDLSSRKARYESLRTNPVRVTDPS